MLLQNIKKKITLSNNLILKYSINESLLFGTILLLSIFPKIGFQNFSLTINSIIIIFLSPFILVKVFNLKINIFKDFILILFSLMIISCFLSLIKNGFDKRNIFNVLKYFEILIYLIIYINAKYLINTKKIDHKKNINIIKYILLIFLYLFFTKIFLIKDYISALSFDLLLSDYSLKLNGFNDYTFNLSNFSLITKGTTSTNLSYVFCFINIFLLVALFKIKNYSKLLLLIMNIIFIFYSVFVFHNTIYITFIPILIATFTFLLIIANYKYKFILLSIYVFVTFLVYQNISDLGFLNKITNVIETSIAQENPRIRIWTAGVNILSIDKMSFFFGTVSPEKLIGYDFFESLFLDSFVKFGLLHLILITTLLGYMCSQILIKNNIEDPNIRIYYLILVFLTPSIIINNMVNSNMIFSELFAPIFFHLYGIINNKSNINEI
mgnify:CR=1 FL=1|tara:strand:- start:187 stop:1500 length:1314 start_codon:yes stop_codon:yes gene_type:complete